MPSRCEVAVVRPHRLGAGLGQRLRGQGGSGGHCPRELRLALLEEGGDALGVVGGPPGLALQVALEVELGVEAVRRRRLDRALGQPEPAGRPGGEPRRDRLGFDDQRGVVDRLPDQPPVGRRLGVERLGEQRQRLGARLAEDAAASDQLPPASGTRPILAKAWMNLAELRRQHDVAGEGDVGARAGGDAVDRADHRLLDGADQPQRRVVEGLERRAEVRRPGRPCAGRGRRGPGRRRSRGRRRSAAPRGPPASAAARSKAGAQREVHLLVEGVELVRAVQREASAPPRLAQTSTVSDNRGLGHQLPSQRDRSLRPVEKVLHKPTGQSIIKRNERGRNADGRALRPRIARLLDQALAALRCRGFWTPFPEVPSGKILWRDRRARTGSRPIEARLGAAFDAPRPPRIGAASAPRSRPRARRSGSPIPPPTPPRSSPPPNRPAPAWAAASPETRVGLLLEALARLNAHSFEMGNAVMHTTGQAFAMAFQAGGPHAQDRGLEAVATAWAEMTRAPASAIWEKPQGKAAPLVSRSTGASSRAASRSSSAARPSRPGTAIPASSPASPPATPSS